jgi:hypothetical protein
MACAPSRIDGRNVNQSKIAKLATPCSTAQISAGFLQGLQMVRKNSDGRCAKATFHGTFALPGDDLP